VYNKVFPCLNISFDPLCFLLDQSLISMHIFFDRPVDIFFVGWQTDKQEYFDAFLIILILSNNLGIHYSSSQ
jgi:hypothetical protein